MHGAGYAIVGPMNVRENPMAAMHTHATKPLGSGKEGNASQMARVHWRESFRNFSGLSIGFLKKVGRGRCRCR